MPTDDLDGALILLDAAEQTHWRGLPPAQQRRMLEDKLAWFRARQVEMIDYYDRADRILEDD
jgi:hypothetical protein